MKHVRMGYAAAVLLFVLPVSLAQAQAPARLVFEPGSRLWIEGTSTLKTWTCEAADVGGYVETDPTAAAGRPTTVLPALSAAELAVPIAGMDCKNDEMHKKVRKSLRAEAQPVIRYEFVRLESAGPRSSGTGSSEALQTLLVTGRLRLAGRERLLNTTVAARFLSDGRVRFTGSQPVLMSDFDIAPPTALLGTLRAGDRVVVNFDLISAPAPNTAISTSLRP